MQQMWSNPPVFFCHNFSLAGESFCVLIPALFLYFLQDHPYLYVVNFYICQMLEDIAHLYSLKLQKSTTLSSVLFVHHCKTKNFIVKKRNSSDHREMLFNITYTKFLKRKLHSSYKKREKNSKLKMPKEVLKQLMTSNTTYFYSPTSLQFVT